MLLVVLILMLVGFGMLVIASMTGTVTWAWVSVAASVVAAVALVSGWRRRWAAMLAERPDIRAELDPHPAERPPTVPPVSTAPAQAEPPAQASPESVRVPSVPQAADAAAPRSGVVFDAPRGGEPGEERVNPADAALVARLDREVLVVDELPRYHLAGCPVLSGRRVVALPAREAVAAEFTPCAVCTPVRVLANTGWGAQRPAGRPR